MHLQLESAAHGILNLDDVLNTDKGVQALSGATGFGLPPVSVQWLETAGDGAMYRGTRTLPRDLDLPLYFRADTRTELQSKLSQFASMCGSGDPLTLRLVDGASSWFLTVYFVGGGDITYGKDTVGEHECQMVVTFRAGDPYWRSATSTTGTSTLNGTGAQVTKTLTINNTGDVAVAPTFTLKGPLIDFAIQYGSGLVGFPTEGYIKYGARVLDGETITVDIAAGTIKDQTGKSRYSNLSVPPQWFKLKPGSNTVQITYTAPVPGQPWAARRLKNFITNPSFEVNTTGWQSGALFGPNGPGAVPGLTFVRDTVQKKAGTASLKITMDTTSGNHEYQGAMCRVTGLDPTRVYRAEAWCYGALGSKPATMTPSNRPKLRLAAPGRIALLTSDNVTGTFTDPWGQWQYAVTDFALRPDPSGTLDVTLHGVNKSELGGVAQSFWFDRVCLYDAGDADDYDNFYTTDPTQGFDGSTVLAGYTFWWDGTAHASTSQADALPVAGTASVDYSFAPARRVVI